MSDCIKSLLEVADWEPYLRRELTEQALVLVVLREWMALFSDPEIAFYATCYLLDIPGEAAFKALQRFSP